MRLIYSLLLWMCVAVVPAGGQQSSSSRQGTADLGMSGAGIRLGPGRNAASVSDDSYHNNAVPIASAFLAWIDVRNGYQHNSVSHAVAIIKRLGYETGAYDTFIRSDSNMITKRTVKGSDGTPLLYGKSGVRQKAQ